MTETLTDREAQAHRLAEGVLVFLESGEPAPGLFDPDVFCDFVLPTWRLQATGVDDTVALRRAGHPGPSTVPRWRFDPTPTGFVLELEEAWEAGGEKWTARELLRADVGEQGIVQLSVYCTGDWSEARRAEHAAAAPLIRP